MDGSMDGSTVFFEKRKQEVQSLDKYASLLAMFRSFMQTFFLELCSTTSSHFIQVHMRCLQISDIGKPLCSVFVVQTKF